MKIFSKKLFKELFLISIVLSAANWLALHYNLYFSVNEFDSLVHFTGGIAVGTGFIFLYYFSGIFNPFDKSFLGFLFMAVFGTIFIGTAWEIFELVSGATSIAEPGYYSDTALDIVMDLLGALIACFYAFSREVSMEKEQIK